MGGGGNHPEFGKQYLAPSFVVIRKNTLHRIFNNGQVVGHPHPQSCELCLATCSLSLAVKYLDDVTSAPTKKF